MPGDGSSREESLASERDFYRRLLDLGGKEEIEPLLDEALALIVEVTGATTAYLELYDDELECEPYLRYGVAAVREPVISRPVEAALTQLQSLVEAVLDAGKFPLVLGGEHSLTVAPVRVLSARHKDLTILQLDAHADLRDGYQGERFSHASVFEFRGDGVEETLHKEPLAFEVVHPSTRSYR